MGTSVSSTAGIDNGRAITGLKLGMERHTRPKRKVVLQWSQHKGGRYCFKMFLPESSTNTDNEVFSRAAWPKQTAVERREKEREAEKSEMASLTYSRERESGSGIWCFFTFNQKQRRAAVEKSMTKS